MTGDLLINGGKVWHAGNDGEGSGLDADTLDGEQLSKIREHGYAMDYTVIDTTTLDPDTWYPVTMAIPNGCNGVLIKVGATHSDQPDVPWSTHENKRFTVTKMWLVTGNWYGWYPLKRKIILSTYHAAEVDPVRGVGQLTHTSNEYVYVRGGAIYKFYTSNNIIPILRTETTQISDQSISPTTTMPAEIKEDTWQLEDSLAYWYENNENNPSTTCNRGGNRNVIESLRSKFKRCVAKPYGDNEVVISYLNANDSTKFPDGSTIAGNAASQTYLMVHFPKYYHKTVEVSSGRWRTYISEVQIDNDYIEEPEMLVGVFEAHKPSEVNWLTSLAGVTSTASQTISTFYTQAQANGTDWGLIDYRAHATIARMFCAYYGTTDISTLNENIPCSGGTKRFDYGQTGGTLSLGNADGRIEAREDAGYYSTSFLGLEDCYYSKWEFVQGLNIIGENYITYDGGCFPGKDVAALEEAGATNIRVIGAKPYSSEAENTYYNGWIRRVAQGRYGDVMPTEIGGSESTYYADYTWQYKQAETGERIFLRSGHSADGSRCGVFVATCGNGSSHSSVNSGSRLGFYGKINIVDSDTFKSIAGI